MRIAAVTPLKFLVVPAAVTVVFVAASVCLKFRTRAMRALAARWGFQYVGPLSIIRWGGILAQDQARSSGFVFAGLVPGKRD